MSFGAAFDLEAPLKAETVALHPLEEGHRAALAAAAADHPAIWSEAGQDDPATPEGFADLFDWLMAEGGGVCVQDADGGHAIGMFRIYQAAAEGDGDRPAFAVGHGFLMPARWGDGTCRVALRPLLEMLFEITPEVWFHLPPHADRAQAAVMKLGAQRHADRILPLGPYGQPALWRRYVLSQSAWLAVERLRALGVRPAVTSG